MNVRNLAQRMLKMSGITSADTTSPGDIALLDRVLAAGDLDDCATEINGAIQEVFDYAPADSVESPLGIVLLPPQAVTLNVTQYSTAITTLTTYAATMIGCTIRIEGDSRDNELKSSTELVRPYMGATTTGRAAMLYFDASLLPATVKAILTPVEISPSSGPPFLHMVTDQEQFRCFDGRIDTLRQILGGGGHVYTTEFNRTVGTPLIGFVAARYDPSAADLQRFIRTNPMPDRAYSLTARARQKPPVFTAADITAVSPPNITLPSEYVESILLPFCKKRWSSHSSCVLTPAQLQEVDRQYRVAKDELDRMNPQVSVTTAHYGP